MFTISSCTTLKAQKLDTPAHHTATGFRNLHIDDTKKTVFGFLAMRLFGERNSKFSSYTTLYTKSRGSTNRTPLYIKDQEDNKIPLYKKGSPILFA
jgi:hypothetical protein